ncbi:SDR family oxidoreductase [Pseudenhygromyxa sp. WMMC2535]|uniref:SDR family oxidoreductase n=1 Tax=Pseudenhygromyxa sp. WMMC2535 TaxID=2712867 RepID=UPI001556BB67|nr:SDR family oxidoreductase [Pseudenhygromyxa sp. WMMC2535]NVB43267.1 SDR family oxidoreductase [Pseudenhygromyxa sp. WMMC2535]
MSLVVLVTGASSGLGRAAAARLAAAGHRVYGSSRAPARVASPPAGVHMLTMDIDDDESVAAGVATVLAEAGRIDVLINNAGISVVGSIEDTSMPELRRQLETNLLGLIRVTRAVLPTMRAQASGKILNVSSLAGMLALPFQGYYSASKFAVEGLTRALRLELRPFGVQACTIAPGDFRTEITTNRIHAAAGESSAYSAQMRLTVTGFAAEEAVGGDPREFAAMVERLVGKRRLAPRYLVGPWLQRLGVTLERLIGPRLFEIVMRRHCRIP